jgi:hypothetical protein
MQAWAKWFKIFLLVNQKLTPRPHFFFKSFLLHKEMNASKVHPITRISMLQMGNIFLYTKPTIGK